MIPHTAQIEITCPLPDDTIIMNNTSTRTLQNIDYMTAAALRQLHVSTKAGIGFEYNCIVPEF
jgi:hypothetical protein